MAGSTVFVTNKSQAVRLPKAVAFPENVREVDVLAVGHARLIVPRGRRWDDFFVDGPHVSGDFLDDRSQPPSEHREDL